MSLNFHLLSHFSSSLILNIFSFSFSSQIFSLFLLKIFSNVWGSLLSPCGCGCGGSCHGCGCGGSLALWVMLWLWVIRYMGVVGGSCHGVCVVFGWFGIAGFVLWVCVCVVGLGLGHVLGLLGFWLMLGCWVCVCVCVCGGGATVSASRAWRQWKTDKIIIYKWIVYCSGYIILLCCLYYFIMFKTKIKPPRCWIFCKV